MPVTAIALSNFWDLACSLSLAPLPSILLPVVAGARSDHPINGLLGGSGPDVDAEDRRQLSLCQPLHRFSKTTPMLRPLCCRSIASRRQQLLVLTDARGRRPSRYDLTDRREQSGIECIGILDLRNVPDIPHHPKRR
jgi:hypothetical protein